MARSNTVITPGDPSLRDLMVSFAKCSSVRYDHGYDLVDINNGFVDELAVVKDTGNSARVTRDCKEVTAGTTTFRLDSPLVWGASFVAPYQVISSPQYLGGQRFEFPLGVYIATTPSKSLDVSTFDVTGYDKIYLLKSDVGDTFAAKDGTLYADNVATLLDMAGIPGAKVSGHLSSTVVDFPADWAVKTIPAGTNMIYPADDSNDYQYIDIINELLKASGCRPLYTSPLGRYVVAAITKPETQSPLWDFARTPTGSLTPDFGKYETVVHDSAVDAADLWGTPNQFVFIQQGLTFDPVEGSGQYTINNSTADATHYRPPADQQTLGRVIRSVQHLNASGQADLVKQGEQIFTDTFSEAEVIELKTAPWPIAWHLDVFRYLDTALDRAYGRKVQAQHWDLALDGGDMAWRANVVTDVTS